LTRNRQLARLRGQRLDAPRHRGIVGEQVGVMGADHPAAGTGRCDEVIAALELGDDLRRELPRIRSIPRVIRGLAAAGLRGRHEHLRAAGLEQLDCR
jgi:hypothetical protein